VTFFSLALICDRPVECLLLCLNRLARPDQVKDQSTTSAVEALQLKELISLEKKNEKVERADVSMFTATDNRSSPALFIVLALK
jgi:hypothetical protein